MRHADALLLQAVRDAPRRYRMPALPPDPDAARAAGTQAALAFAIEGVRLAQEQGVALSPQVQQLFIAALADLVRASLAPQGGDPAFQALVLRAQDAQVQEHVRLAAQANADARALRAAVDAIAHPGKLRGLPAGARREALQALHAHASTADWRQLRAVAQHLGLDAIHASPALERLERGAALLAHAGVQRYRELCELRGPAAGSDAASAGGRNSARLGADAEQQTLAAFEAIAAFLAERAPAAGYRAIGSLRTPRGFPGAMAKAKAEWDAAIVRADDGGAAIVLLAEVKAAPAAATPDFSRLLRGLERLAHADAAAAYDFASSTGAVRIHGASLRELQPRHHRMPPNVIYCCSAPAEAQPALLAAASQAVLLAEPASIAFAQQLLRGGPVTHDALLPVLQALGSEPRLRSALHQYQTSTDVRAAMLRPDDLLATLRAQR